MKVLARCVHNIYMFRRKINSEEVFLQKTLQRNVREGAKLLDIGCGFSRFYDIICRRGVEYVGVDVNPETVDYNRRLGRTVFLEPDLLQATDQYDVLLLSHVIEHFDPSQLVDFLNQYLSRLREGGIVVIFTPLLHRGFYDDFDHIKPYPPAAIRQLFCKSSKQTRGFGLIGDYVELGVWFKRDSLWHTHRVGKWTHLFSLPLTVASALTYGVLGRLTGYGIVLKKSGYAGAPS